MIVKTKEYRKKEKERMLDEEKLLNACKEGDWNFVKEKLNKSDININCKDLRYLSNSLTISSYPFFDAICKGE